MIAATTVALALAASPPPKRHYATAYCLRGRTASGVYTRPGVVAHNFYPFGTRIRLVGKRSFFGRRRFTVRDTGPALADGHFDLWTGSCSKAVQWGRRSIRFRVRRP